MSPVGHTKDPGFYPAGNEKSFKSLSTNHSCNKNNSYVLSAYYTLDAHLSDLNDFSHVIEETLSHLPKVTLLSIELGLEPRS